jgi:hypothetical protein
MQVKTKGKTIASHSCDTLSSAVLSPYLAVGCVNYPVIKDHVLTHGRLRGILDFMLPLIAKWYGSRNRPRPIYEPLLPINYTSKQILQPLLCYTVFIHKHLPSRP